MDGVVVVDFVAWVIDCCVADPFGLPVTAYRSDARSLPLSLRSSLRRAEFAAKPIRYCPTNIAVLEYAQEHHGSAMRFPVPQNRRAP